ncbi:T9SS type A sorting domain-containing protein [Mariniflexile sp. AS56]|uniref:T9SS type A sorting domain-containing protein n=1 Tax=Mariniflexile sp. AS56 TaxID=3063957 RepID=UPI0026F103A0|nr:T9SS type A sorting domain-containing protein [Mariniflexile sp. AS56]MDO7172502.1 T9SS type A sorting domain-containing protein [Mariniflexile sp. AS56]
MKKPLHKLTLILTVLLAAQISFGQLVNVTLDNAIAGTAHYTVAGKRDNPNNAINDTFGGVGYDPTAPTNNYPDCEGSGLANYFLPKANRDENYWGCYVSIPATKSLKYLDFYATEGVQTSSGAWDRFRDLTITLSDGVNTEDHYWEGVSPVLAQDADPHNYARMDFVERGFSAGMLASATSIRIDHSNADSDAFLQFMELRLAADNTPTAGINDLKAAKLLVSPNPLQEGESLKIDFTNATTNSVQVYSILGEFVYEEMLTGVEVSINYNIFPSSGIYIVKIGSSVSKVVIK